MTATIRLTRSSGIGPGCARALQVLLDGKKAAPIKAGQMVEYQVQPGRHRLQVKQDFCASDEVTLAAEEGSTTALECGCFVEGWKFFLMVLWVWRVFAPGKLFWVKRKA